jgi:hypothetical protein
MPGGHVPLGGLGVCLQTVPTLVEQSTDRSENRRSGPLEPAETRPTVGLARACVWHSRSKYKGLPLLSRLFNQNTYGSGAGRRFRIS